MTQDNNIVGLVIPPSIFLLDERVFVSLGILKVAASLEANGYKVEMLDLSGVANYEEACTEFAKVSQARWIGITATTPQMPAVTKVVRKFRENRPDLKIMVGGPHPTLIQAAWKREVKERRTGRATKALDALLVQFDCVVAGDGEEAILKVLQADGASRLIDADDPKGPLFLSVKKITEAPLPARHLVDMSSYHYTIDGVPSVSYITQMGCPMGCNFSVTGDTIIETPTGYVTIESLMSGEGRLVTCEHGGSVLEYSINRDVRTMDGVAKATVAIAEGIRPVYKITTSEGVSVTATAEHQFLECVGEDFKWTRVDQIKHGAKLSMRIPLMNLELSEEMPYYDCVLQVSSIESAGEQPVYDLKVPGNHSFIANFFVSHNCGGRESPMLRRLRARDPKDALAEVEHLYKTYGYLGYMDYSDEQNIMKGFVPLMKGMVDLQSRLGVEFRLRGFIKSELFTEEQAEWMHKAGFRWILVGFESGSERILENINKKATVEDNTRCMDIASKYGLKVKALMSVGHAGESEQTIRDTQQWLLKVKPADFDVTVITTYPGTPYYDRAVETAPGIWTYTAPENGDRLHAIELDYNETADYYKGDPDGGYKAYVYTDLLTSERLVELRDEVERTVRAQLGIPYNVGAAALRFEHSMGQPGPLPKNILRTTGEI